MFCSLFKEKEAEFSFETDTAITLKEVVTACKDWRDSIELLDCASEMWGLDRYKENGRIERRHFPGSVKVCLLNNLVVSLLHV